MPETLRKANGAPYRKPMSQLAISRIVAEEREKRTAEARIGLQRKSIRVSKLIKGE